MQLLCRLCIATILRKFITFRCFSLQVIRSLCGVHSLWVSETCTSYLNWCLVLWTFYLTFVLLHSRTFKTWYSWVATFSRCYWVLFWGPSFHFTRLLSWRPACSRRRCLLHRGHCLYITQYPIYRSTCLRSWCMLEWSLWLYISQFLIPRFTCLWRYWMFLRHFGRRASLLVTRCLLADLSANKLDYHIIICWLVFWDCRLVIEFSHLFDHNIWFFTLSFIHWLSRKGRCSTSLRLDRCNLWRLLRDSFAWCCIVSWLQSVLDFFDETLMAVWGHWPSWYTLLKWMIGLTPVLLWWKVSLDFPWAFPLLVWYWTKRLVCLL